MEQRLLTRKEAAKYCGVSLRYLDENLAAWQIDYGVKKVRFGSAVRICRQSLDRMIERKTTMEVA